MAAPTDHDEIDNLRYQVNIDISKMATRCEDIEKRLNSLESRFHFDPETTIVAQDMPHIGGEDIIHLANDLGKEG